jgi:hypothetical protein
MQKVYDASIKTGTDLGCKFSSGFAVEPAVFAATAAAGAAAYMLA